MTEGTPMQPAGWYYAQGDPPGTQRYWDGTQWQGGPQPVPGSVAAAPNTANLGSPGNRILARIIDGIIWIIIGTIIGAIFGTATFTLNPDEVDTPGFLTTLLSALVGTALVAGYEIFFVGTRGATPGKMALGLKVVRVDGSAADTRDATMRMAIYIVTGVLAGLGAALALLTGLVQIVVGIVSLVFLFTDPIRQTVWDKVAKTKVISAK